MNVKELLDEARRLNLTLTASGSGIRVTPSGQLPDALRRAILEHKALLVRLLEAAAPPKRCQVPALPPPSMLSGSVEPEPSQPAEVPAIPCPRCELPYPGDPNCVRCEVERARVRRLAREAPDPKCGRCGRAPGSNPACDSCVAAREQAKYEGREDEGWITPTSRPGAARGVIGARLRQVYGRD